MINFEPIGHIRTCYPDRFGTPRQPGLVADAWSCLQIDSKWQPELSLLGLASFSHVWLIFLFHQNTNQKFNAKVHPPRMGGESIGLFATRSPHRPNPIGLSVVQIESVGNDHVIFRGADLVDGTPILDLKPYLPEIESLPDAKAGWTTGAAASNIQVLWTSEIEQTLSDWSIQIRQPQLKEIIEQTLSLDPRPLVYRGFESVGTSAPYRSAHAVRFFDGDVHFRFVSPTQIEILQIRRNS